MTNLRTQVEELRDEIAKELRDSKAFKLERRLALSQIRERLSAILSDTREEPMTDELKRTIEAVLKVAGQASPTQSDLYWRLRDLERVYREED